MKSCPPVLFILLCQAIIISIGTTQHSKLTGHCHQNWWKPANVLPHSTWSSPAPFTLSSLSCLSDEFITFVHIIKLCQWFQRHPVALLFPLFDWLCAAIVQLEAIKNVDKIISNSIYILKDNLPFTGTNNIINSINLPVLPLCLRCVAIHRCRCRIWNLSCGAARCLFTFLPSLSHSHRWRFYNLSAIEIQQTFLNLFAWLHFGRAFSQRASAERGAGAKGFRFHGCPQRAHFAFASNIHRLLWLMLLLLLSLSLHLAPVEVPAWHPLFWFLSTAWICKLPGLNRAWPACRGGNKASHFTTSSNCVGRILAAAPRCLKTFLAKCFFFLCFLANQTCCRTSLPFDWWYDFRHEAWRSSRHRHWHYVLA